MTTPQNKLFIVREDKADEFLNAKRDEEAFKILMDRADIFRKNLKIINENSPVKTLN